MFIKMFFHKTTINVIQNENVMYLKCIDFSSWITSKRKQLLGMCFKDVETWWPTAINVEKESL